MEMKWVKVIDEFYKDFEKRFEKAEEEMEKVEIKDEPAGEDCENCGSPMVFKMGRYGNLWLVVISRIAEIRKLLLKKLVLHVLNVKKGKSLKEKVKSVDFLRCNRYPECDFVSWDKPLCEIVQNVKLF